MKKRLFAILLALTLALTLLPTAAFAAGEGSADLGTTKTHCYNCDTITTFRILAYIRTPIASKPDPRCHWARAKCMECGEIEEFVPEGEPAYHSGGIETPTCTTGKICEKCGDEYGILGHDWGDWQSNNDGKTHTRSCQREGCDAVDTANCGGDGNATCAKLGTCTDCGGQYYGGHSFPKTWKWGSDPAVERDAESHWLRCSNCKEGKAYEKAHSFGPGNMYLKSAATCISLPVYYMNCTSCYYKGTDTYVYQWGQLDPNNHDWAAATCTAPKTCKVCNATEGNALDHDWGKWTSNGDGTHTRTCSRDKSHSENGKCSGGKADCCHKAKCEVCGGAYGSLASDNHSDLKHFPAKRATTHAEGNIEYWYCSGCGKYYKDAGATKEITQKDTAIRKRRSSSGSTTGDKTIESPKTGDAGIVLYIGMAALSLTGGVWLRRKEQ